MIRPFIALLLLIPAIQTLSAAEPPVARLKALLVAGGWCHDYAGQHKVLAAGKQARAHVPVDVAWTHEKQGALGFSTTPGHHTESVADPGYLDLVARGLLWACGKLDDAHWQPDTGADTITDVDAAAAKEKTAAQFFQAAAPKDATPVTPRASSVQDGHFTWMAVDGDNETRWCASSAHKPEWLQLEFEQPSTVDGVFIIWEKREHWYQYTLETSQDGQIWTMAADRSKNTARGDTTDKVAAQDIRYLRVTVLGQERDQWSSLWEIQVTGPGIKSIFPKVNAKTAATLESPGQYRNGGNIEPRITQLTPAEEAAILKDVTVPAGFDVTLFAPAATANYPVYVAAAPSGDLYVSSDGNGSLGRDPDRGRVLRLRDIDGDGRADQVTEFIADVDSPRGLIWDHDRLYLLHPPDITVYFDHDGDGVAEASQRLIEGIAFGFDKRPADHTSNGLELGMDGWIYMAGGDFGFMDALGTDGRHLQHRGGGVIRFRPDGSGLEIFATGTRNILGTPMSPLLDLFARDNTNDGGGWDVRFHHFSGLEDHGYPWLYKNFGDEHIQPLADYGGGSGCGSVYIHEPGFPKEWGSAPFTCDWGRAALFRHSVARQGAGIVETDPPEPFIKMTRPTDADIDGMSRVYQASWKGPATFKWAGPDQGYIVRVAPQGFKPEPLPDFGNLADAQLISLLESPSHVRTLTAQRTLLRRKETKATTDALLALAGNASKELPARIAALYAVTQRGVDSRQSARVIQAVSPLVKDAALQPFVLRALGDMGMDELTAGMPGPAPAELLIDGATSKDPRTRIEAVIAAARQRSLRAAPAIAANLGHTDPVIAHTAFRSLALLGASGPCFDVLDSGGSTGAQRLGAAHALMRMHRADVVDGLIARLDRPSPSASLQPILAALCRLYHREAEWKGDSWGTRPDTRGPYYQPVVWEQSDTIIATLQNVLATATADEAARLISEMNRNRIQSDAALNRIIELAARDESHLPAAMAQLAALEVLPVEAIPLLLKAARDPKTPPIVRAQSIECLSKTEHPEGLAASLTALAKLETVSADDEARRAGRNAFLRGPTLESRHAELARIAGKSPSSDETWWAHAGLLELASRKNIGPEARAQISEALDVAWQDTARRAILIHIAGELRNHYLDARIGAAMGDPDPDVAAAAASAAKRLRIPAPGEDTTPKIESLSPEQALARVVDMKGDRALGEAVFIRASCASCHTVSQDQPLKGPYLGNIATTYRRPDLAASVLDPNKTIAQGFATQVITLKDESELTGFITNEAGDKVTLRNIAALEYTIDKSQIVTRAALATSMMPTGLADSFTVKEVASLLDYLEGLTEQ